jgi:hypothetical protein
MYTSSVCMLHEIHPYPRTVTVLNLLHERSWKKSGAFTVNRTNGFRTPYAGEGTWFSEHLDASPSEDHLCLVARVMWVCGVRFNVMCAARE